MKYSGYFYLIWPRPEGKTSRKIRKAKAFGKKYSTWRLSGTAGEGIRYGVSGKTARFRLPMYSRKGTAMSGADRRQPVKRDGWAGERKRLQESSFQGKKRPEKKKASL